MLQSAMRNRLSLFYFLLALSCAIQSTKAAFEFRLGAVLSRRGETGEMRDARRGYKLFFDMANAKGMDSDFMMLGGGNGSAKFSMTYNFLWRDDNSSNTTHIEKLEKLIGDKNLTFLLGSHPDYAAQEMNISNRSDLLNFQCCVGPDSFYEDHDYKKVFGMHVSNGRYVTATMRKLSLEKVQKLWILVDESSNFTRTTCEAALDVETFEGNVSENMAGFEYKSFDGSSTHDSFFQGFAADAAKENVEAVIACVSKLDGETLVNAFHDISYPLKAFFLTVGPTSREWIDKFSNNVSDSLLSAAQWHKDMLYNDSFFGSAAQYAEEYKREYEEEPSYVSASASATGLILHYAIKEAFKDCDLSLTNGNISLLLNNSTAISCESNDKRTGYERVVEALRKTNRKIFFGKVKFNRFRRNVGNIPVTTQVLWDKDKRDDSESSPIMAVLPLKHATASEFRFSAKNYYPKDCTPGFYIGPDPFDRCRTCEKGSVSKTNESEACDSCLLGEYIDKDGQSECFQCPSGTRTSQRGSKSILNCSCDEHFYNPSGQSGVECFPCPTGAYCEGGSYQPFPEEGYWMNKTWPDAAYPCDPGSVCLGNFTCRPGNKGRLCAECEDGYYSIIHRCYECPHVLIVVVLLIALLTLWYLINVVISRSIASLEMLLDWAQLANIIGDIDLNWPPRLIKMFGIASVLDFDVDILEPSCLMRTWGFRENLSVQLFLPLFITLLAVVGYLLSKLVFFLVKRDFLRLNEENTKRLSWFVSIPNSNKDLSRKWDRVVATFFTFVNVTYITLTKYCLDAFRCQNIAGERVLSASPSVVCNTKQHDEIVALGVIGISVYVVGYVGYTTWTLFYLRKNEAFHKEKYICRYGFIYQNFEVRCFLSPIFILIQKLLFVVVLVFFNEPVFQIGALVMIIIASLMIQVSTNPYLDTKNDILVTFLLSTLMFEAFGGLMLYNNNNLSDKDSTVLEWIILTALLLLFLVFFVIFFIEISNKYYIHLVKHYQRAFVVGGSGRDLGLTCSVAGTEHDEWNLETSVSFGGTLHEGRHQSGLLQLVDTFKPLYVYKCMQTDPDFTEDWDKLTNLFSGFISRHSSASYWSLRPSAKFWRRMVNQFPEIVDFLAVADEETLAQFNEIAKRLYKDFFLANQVHPLPLMTLLNWRDRAPMAHWLSVASKEDKQLFLRTTERMLATIGYQNISDSMHAKIQQRGRNVFLKEPIVRRHVRRKQQRNMQLIASGSSPLDRPSIDNLRQSFRHELEMRKQNVSAFASGPRIAMSNESSILDAVPENNESIEESVDADREPLLGSWSEDLSNTRHTHYEEVNRTYSAGCTEALAASVRSSCSTSSLSNARESN